MKHQKITPIALTVGLLFGSAAYAAADTPAQGTELQQVKVKGRRNAPAAVERVNAEVIQD